MPTRLDPGINAHPIPAGVVLSTDEWARLTAPLGLAADHPLDEVFLVLVGRVDASYNVAHTVRELLDAGEPSSSVPPKDLPGAIRRIGQARHRAEQQAKQFAGEVADLTDRLERVLPDVFHAVIRDVAFDRGDRQAELQWEDIEESAELALTLTLSLVTSYDVRNRDQARPVDTDPAARHLTVTLNQPGDQSDYWTRPGQPPPAWTEQDRAAVQLWGVTINPLHPAVLYLADHIPALKGCSGTPDCRRALIANTLLDAADDVRVATSTTGAPHDDWIRRAAERLADITLTLGTRDDSLDALSRLLRDASQHAFRTLNR